VVCFPILSLYSVSTKVFRFIDILVAGLRRTCPKWWPINSTVICIATTWLPTSSWPIACMLPGMTVPWNGGIVATRSGSVKSKRKCCRVSNQKCRIKQTIDFDFGENAAQGQHGWHAFSKQKQPFGTGCLFRICYRVVCNMLVCRKRAKFFSPFCVFCFNGPESLWSLCGKWVARTGARSYCTFNKLGIMCNFTTNINTLPSPGPVWATCGPREHLIRPAS